LENKCLIEKEVNSPTRYTAVAPEIILPMLVKRKQTEIFDLKTKAEAIADSFRNKQPQMPEVTEEGKEKPFFKVIPGKEVIVHRLKRLLQEAQVSVDVVTTHKRFSSAILEFAEDYKKPWTEM
jgi:sugar-specific transcriptional regulator TrmB